MTRAAFSVHSAILRLQKLSQAYEKDRMRELDQQLQQLQLRIGVLVTLVHFSDCNTSVTLRMRRQP